MTFNKQSWLCNTAQRKVQELGASVLIWRYLHVWRYVRTINMFISCLVVVFISLMLAVALDLLLRCPQQASFTLAHRTYLLPFNHENFSIFSIPCPSLFSLFSFFIFYRGGGV